MTYNKIIIELQEAASWIEGVATKPYDKNIKQMIKGIDKATGVIRQLSKKQKKR